MITWRNGTVSGSRREWPGAVELDVLVDNGAAAGVPVRALAYPALTGRPRPGDRVLVNTTALDLGLGTGGYALVIAVPDRLPPDPELPGHLVKARYSPLQATVLGADEQGSPHHEVLRTADDIGGMPVVVADLHSALPAVLAGVFSGTERAGSSRPASGRLLAARHVLGADVAVVAQGPGNLGTGTRWGFSGVAAGEAVNAVAALGGRPVASLRISDADPRERHRGVSHHSLTAYGRVALARADVVLPDLGGEFGGLPDRVAAAAAGLGERHELVTVPVDGLEAALRSCPARLSTMGRGLDEDLAYFLAAAAAGRHAGRLLRAATEVSPA
jgi:Protein of unknown function (DUF3866)